MWCEMDSRSRVCSTQAVLHWGCWEGRRWNREATRSWRRRSGLIFLGRIPGDLLERHHGDSKPQDHVNRRHYSVLQSHHSNRFRQHTQLCWHKVGCYSNSASTTWWHQGSNSKHKWNNQPRLQQVSEGQAPGSCFPYWPFHPTLGRLWCCSRHTLAKNPWVHFVGFFSPYDGVYLWWGSLHVAGFTTRSSSKSGRRRLIQAI